MQRKRSISYCLATTAFCALSAYAQPAGQWDFNSGTLAGTVGAALEYWDGAGGATEQQTQFGTTTSFGLPDIGGQVAQVMLAPDATETMGFAMPVTAEANNGFLVNSYTLIWDLLVPAESHSTWRALLEADGRALDQDAEFFINPGNGIGISGNYSGTIQSNTWYRIGLVVNGENQTINKYINGALVGSQTFPTLDDRFALSPGGSAYLFADNDGDSSPLFVNSIQFRGTALTQGEMAALGGPSAAGIPQTIPAIPSFVESQNPAPGATGTSPLPTISATINQGNTTITASSVKLLLDGTELPATATVNGSQVQISYAITNLFEPLSTHTVTLNYSDTTGAKTTTWTFTVGDYKALTLPAPLAFENFDAVAEGELPAGWSVTNNTTSINTGVFDVLDASSDSYLDFVVISRATLSATYNANRLSVQPYLVNGVPVPDLVINNFAYAESDVRGGSQVQMLFSPDFNIAGKTNIYVAFHSIYAQNQDNIAGVEYSTDGGATWEPALYMLDGPDILRDGEGLVDAFATLNEVRGDHAHGLAYGEFLGVTSNRWSTLAPFISQRVDDNHVESKRIELLRLAAADGKQNVRLRFFHAGTASWYFGVDNVGVYSIEAPLPPNIIRQPVGGVVSAGVPTTLRVEADGAGLTYQWRLDGTNIAGATSAEYTIDNTQTSSEGSYTVVIKNQGGEVTSLPAVLEVFSGAIGQELVTHLKFENNYDDSSPRNNDAMAMGNSSFGAGIIGSAVLIPSGTDYVMLATTPDLNFGTSQDFSIAFWAKVTGVTGDPSFIGNKNWGSGGNQGYVIASDDDRRVQWNVAGAPGGRRDYDSPGGIFPETEWRHVVLTFDRQGNTTTYIDGVVRDSRFVGDNLNNLDTPAENATNLGQDGTGFYGSSFTDLYMDDVALWRRVVTPQEVAAMHTAGRAGQDLSTVVVGGGGGAEPEITAVSRNGNNLVITATGDGTLSLQKKTTLSDAWAPVTATPANGTFTVPIEGSAGFFRVVSQ
jgi:hypothetical protein